MVSPDPVSVQISDSQPMNRILNEYFSKLEEAINRKSATERELFETNEENRSLKHECLRSTEDKKIAEALIETVKDQLRRSEEKLAKYVEVSLRLTLQF